MKIWTALLATVFVLAVVPSGEASGRLTTCYNCKSWEDPGCWDVRRNDSRYRKYSRLCDDEEIPPGAHTFCRIIHQKIRDGNGTERLWRKCGWIEYYGKHNRDCYSFSDGHHDEVVCQCFEDNCNSASLSSLTPGALAAALGASLLRHLYT